MSNIVFLIEQIAIGLYILIGVGILIFWSRWRAAQFDIRSTRFELERDFARFRRDNALTMMILSIEMALIVLGIQRIVAPTMRSDIELEQLIAINNQTDVVEVVSDGVFATPTRPAPLSNLPIEPVELPRDDEVSVFATPTLTPTPVGTIEPNAPPVYGCNTPNAFLQIPANGMRVFQTIRVAGTAFVDDFSRYKLEISGPTTQNSFWVIDEGTIPVRVEDTANNTLSQFNPDPYTPGTYQFQLTVFDTTNELKASCMVTIYISRPIPTPTPLGG
ncbi:MAG: hypothetical protein MUE54_01565 [Anaerolineae bacterium]|nr:hypothetical protein [Anaerolineae bacterium]